MKVKELIQQLQELDQESIVVVRGYEGGVDDVVDVTPVQVQLNVNSSWWLGKHEICDDTSKRHRPKPVSAVFVS